MLMCQLVPSRSMAHRMMAEGKQATMKHRVPCLSWLPGPVRIQVAMIASIFFGLGLDGCVIIIRLKEDIMRQM